jgi:hypothetical protein
LEEKQTGWPKATTQTQGHLGHPSPPPKQAPVVRNLAMFNLAIDSKLRGCDLVVEFQ